MTSQLRTSHTPGFAQDGGHIVVTRGETNRPHYTLYPDSPPLCFRIGASSECNWRVAAPGVAAHHVELIWDGHELFVEPLAGAPAVLLNGATHRHRVRLVGDSKLELGQASLHILLGSEASRTAPELPTRGASFHVSRPPKMLSEERAHVRTSLGLVSPSARTPEQLNELAQKLAKRVATEAAERDKKRMKALARTQPMFAVDLERVRAAHEGGGALVVPQVVVAPDRAPSVAPRAPLRVRGYASERPPAPDADALDSSRSSGTRARVFSDVPLPPSRVPFAREAGEPPHAPAATPTRSGYAPRKTLRGARAPENLQRTVSELPAYPTTREQPAVREDRTASELPERPAAPLRRAIPPRAFAASTVVDAPRPPALAAPPGAVRAPSLISSPAAVRERHVREFELQREALLYSQSERGASAGSALAPAPPLSLFASAHPAAPKRSRRGALLVAAIVLTTFSPLALRDVRDELGVVAMASAGHPLVRALSARVERGLKAGMALVRLGERAVPTPPSLEIVHAPPAAQPELGLPHD